jgi:hypothetical protein
MMVVRAPPPSPPTLRQLHKRKCFLLGITDPAKEERLWQAEVARRKCAEERDRRERQAQAEKARSYKTRHGG